MNNRHTLIQNLSKILYLIFTILVLQLSNFWINDNQLASINDGMIFGLLGSNLLSFVTSLIFLLILYCIFYKNNKYHTALILITAGTVSNILDRFFYGGVIDYIKVLSWPAFNLADIFILAGLLWVVWTNLNFPKR